MIPEHSPDVEAWLCYLVVGVIGLLIAIREVKKRFESVSGQWACFGTYLLLLAYMAIPVALYFILDWTGAIRDTSIFAAIFVAFFYERILTGQAGQQVKVAESLTSWWPSFLAWANAVASTVGLKIRENEEFFDKMAVAYIARRKDEIFERFQNLAQSGLFTDKRFLDEDLKPIEEEFQKIQVDEKLKKERKAQIIFANVKYPAQFRKALRDEKIIGWSFYKWYGKRWRMAVKQLGTVGLAAGLALIIVFTYFGQLPSWTDYYAWRLRKTNTSQFDQYRAAQGMAEILKKGASAPKDLDQLAQLLQRPDFPAERVSILLRVFYQSRDFLKGRQKQLQGALLGALRTSRADVRFQVHQVLLFLAPSWGVSSISDSLKSWRPLDNESVTDVEQRLEEWEKILNSSQRGG
jgi:hypothetical protein